MITSGPCAECGVPLAADQRYCVECGTRVGAPLALPYAAAATPTEAAAMGAGAGQAAGLFAALPMPIQAVTTFAALALGFGVVVGTAISPNLAGTVAGPLVVQAPPAAEPEPEPASGGGGGAAAPAAVAAAPATSGSFFSDTGSSTGTTGGGSGKTKQPKEKPTYATGTVVHANPVAGSYSLASNGSLTAVHTNKALPSLGSLVKVPIRDLANLTSAEDGKRKITGQAGSANFSGIVTYNHDSSDPAIRDTYVLSARGVSVLVHAPADTSPGTTNKPPPVASLINSSVEVKDLVAEPAPAPPVVPPAPPTCAAPPAPLPSPPIVPSKGLYETAIRVDAPASDVDGSEIETVVQSVCAGTGQLLASADDIRATESDFVDPLSGLVLIAAPGVGLGAVAPGQAVIANIQLVEDSDPGTPPGTKTFGKLTGLRSDQGIKGADDSSSAQGDLRLARSVRRLLARSAGRAAAREGSGN